MNTYSVKEIAEMLNTNPETVRRWIRNKKLDATITSKKEGHIVTEKALREFLHHSPKYAATMKNSLAGVAVVSTIMVSGLVAQKKNDSGQLKNARVKKSDLILFLEGKIQECSESIETKENTIHQLEKQIDDDKLQIAEYKKLIDSLNMEENESIEFDV